MIKINPRDFIDRNPAFSSGEDVAEYIETYDNMKQHSALVLNSQGLDSDISFAEAKIRCEKFLINAETLLEEYGRFIDYSKVDYTYDQLFKMQEKALTQVQETSINEMDWELSVYHVKAFHKFSSAMIQCLQKSGLSVMGWEIEASPGDTEELRHSFCEENKDSNDGDT